MYRRRRRRAVAVLALPVLLAVIVAVQLQRGVPGARVSVVLPAVTAVPGARARLPWPTQGSAAVRIQGVADLGGVRADDVRPLASVTKLITALVVLKGHPLAPGQSGPTIAISRADARAYKHDLADGQSVLKVAAGERLSELQALEGMLIPSGDNMARILASWSAGGKARFVRQMNAEATALGLRQLHLAGPSGLNPASVGTAADVSRLGAAAIRNPVIRQIVAMPAVTLPVAGTVENYDDVLGEHGIIGIKTGSMSAAGGNFAFAARRRVGARTLTIVGAVLGAPTLQQALDDSARLAGAAASEVREVAAVPAGRRVLRISSGWAPTVVARTTRAARIVAVPGQRLTTRVALDSKLQAGKLQQLQSGTRVATVEVRYRKQTIRLPVKVSGTLPGPSILYRLTRL